MKSKKASGQRPKEKSQAGVRQPGKKSPAARAPKQLKAAEKRRPTLYVKGLADPKAWANRLLLFETVKGVFPNAENARQLAKEPIVVFFKTKEEMQSAASVKVGVFGENAFVELPRMLTYEIAIPRIPIEFEGACLEGVLKSQIDSIARCYWKNKKKRKRATLVVVTTSESSFKAVMKRGFVNIGFDKFNVEEPKKSVVVCWNCHREGHTSKICFAQKQKKIQQEWSPKQRPKEGE